MNEINKSEKDKQFCNNCGKPIDNSKSIYCTQCQIKLAEEKIPITQELPKNKKKKPIFVIIKWVLLIMFSVLIIINAFFIINLVTRKNSKSYNLPELNKETVLCISNLEYVLEQMRSGEFEEDSIYCPLSEKPYEISIKNGDTIISCPEPEKHNLISLGFSSKDSMPEIVK